MSCKTNLIYQPIETIYLEDAIDDMNLQTSTVIHHLVAHIESLHEYIDHVKTGLTLYSAQEIHTALLNPPVFVQPVIPQLTQIAKKRKKAKLLKPKQNDLALIKEMEQSTCFSTDVQVCLSTPTEGTTYRLIELENMLNTCTETMGVSENNHLKNIFISFFYRYRRFFRDVWRQYDL